VIEEVLIAGIQPGPDGTRGRSAGAQAGARLDVERSVILDSHEMGLWYLFAQGSVRDTYVENTSQSPLGEYGLADGFLATSSTVDVENLVSRDNERAGVLYDQSDGDLSGSFITGNGIGVLDQGEPGATIAPDLLVQDNQKNFLQNETLEIPQEEMDLPAPPVVAQ